MSEDEDPDKLARELDRETARLQDESERVGEHIKDARQDWEGTKTPTAPGQQPDDADEAPAGELTDEATEGSSDEPAG